MGRTCSAHGERNECRWRCRDQCVLRGKHAESCGSLLMCSYGTTQSGERTGRKKKKVGREEKAEGVERRQREGVKGTRQASSALSRGRGEDETVSRTRRDSDSQDLTPTSPSCLLLAPPPHITLLVYSPPPFLPSTQHPPFSSSTPFFSTPFSFPDPPSPHRSPFPLLPLLPSAALHRHPQRPRRV